MASSVCPGGMPEWFGERDKLEKLENKRNQLES